MLTVQVPKPEENKQEDGFDLWLQDMMDKLSKDLNKKKPENVFVPKQEKNPAPVKETVKTDIVNHPTHYTDGGIETIDFIEAKKLNYNLGNVVKYVSRAGKKEDALTDLKKARWYLMREIESYEKK